MIRTKKTKKLITVYMPVFNASKFLHQSIESILDQTYSNFEFIIVDDASTDNSWKIIRSYAKKDKRIIAIRNNINLGVSLTSNIAISKAKGQFLARMDADDISFSNRLESQLNYFKKHPNTVAIGGQCVVIDENNHLIGNKNFPTKAKKLKEMIFWAIPMQQPSMMINLDKLPQNFTWYTPNVSSAEEINLMFRLMLYGNLANLPQNLLFYRHLETSLSHKNPKETFKLTLNSRYQALSFGFRPSVKAIFLNLLQIIAVSLIPAHLINEIWYRIRGIKNTNNHLTVRTYAESQV
jgi:glycosyltransferase involved in cell wall biosynthesis